MKFDSPDDGHPDDGSPTFHGRPVSRATENGRHESTVRILSGAFAIDGASTAEKAVARRTQFIVGALLLTLWWGSLSVHSAEIEVRIPPPGIELPAVVRDSLQQRYSLLAQQAAELGQNPLRADVLMLLKAVRLALVNNEFYKEQDAKKAEDLLDLAEQRLKALEQGESPWTDEHGLLVRGFLSRIDGSAQPYGLVIPEQLDLEKPQPLYVWLHGRGDTTTDMHFLHQRLSNAGQVQPDNAIVLHPFGRHCIGFKSAGEIDVLEAIDHVSQQYSIDPERIVLMGFSMGGAGAWHLGAHYADHWVAVSPGAGFAETASYNRLQPRQFPAWYTRTLWHVYDVPSYVRNLFNIPVIAYSGEQDKQIQAAQVMEAAFLTHGRQLRHVIGPGMGHKYHPDSLRDILASIDQAVQRGRQPLSNQVYLQTRTLRYSRMYWVQVEQLTRHWEDTRVDAQQLAGNRIRLETSNVERLRLTLWQQPKAVTVFIDGQRVEVPASRSSADVLLQRDGQWRWAGDNESTTPALRKRPGLQGPIDDIFMTPILVVTPTGTSSNQQLETWADSELQHLRRRWRTLFRAELPEKRDVEVSAEDLQSRNLLVWGDPDSNRLLRRMVDAGNSPTSAHRLPVAWHEETIEIGDQKWSRQDHVPVCIYPNPLNPEKYVVINSGPTFREGHDRTNSLQNPQLPDWAVLDIRQPPNEFVAGRVVAAEFFDEFWQVPPVLAPDQPAAEAVGETDTTRGTRP